MKTEWKCPRCGSTKFIHDYERGELICTNCGLVLQDHIIDRGPYWYALEADKRHTGPPASESIHDRGVSSRMGRENRDVLGRALTPEQAAKFRRLRRQDQRAHVTNHERTLTRVFQEQARICHNLGLPRFVSDRAAFLFRKALKNQLVRGRSVEATAAALIYIVSRELGLRRSLSKLAQESGVALRDLRRAYKLLSETFCIRPSPIGFAYYIDDATKNLGLGEETRRRVFEQIGQHKTISEKEVLKKVAAAIYAVCRKEKRKINRAQIAKAVNFSRASLSKLLKERNDE